MVLHKITKNSHQKVLDTWNDVAKKRDTDAFMHQFDNSDDIILVGSDSAEISMGRTDIKKFIGSFLLNSVFNGIIKASPSPAMKTLHGHLPMDI